MLKKVMKYEWISTGKVLVLIHIVLAIVTLIGNLEIGFMKQSGNADWASGNTAAGTVMNTIFGVSLFVYILIVFTAVVGTLVYLIVRYYKSMYTDEGYLTHTLPVNTHTIMWGKTIVAVCWFIIDAAAVILSIWSIVSTATGVHFSELTDEIGKLIAESGMSSQIPGLVILFVINMILTVLCSWEKIMASFSLGQLANDHRVLLSIAIYIGLNIVSEIVGFIIGLGNMNTWMEGAMDNAVSSAFPTTLMTKVMWIGAVYDLIFTAAFYIIAYTITKKKLNLE